MEINRRTFIYNITSGSVCFVAKSGSVCCLINACANTNITRNKLEKLRMAARFRKRRVIMNNDGNDIISALKTKPYDPENLLKQRSLGLIGSQVDSIFYCTGVFNLYTHQSEENELLTRNDPAIENYLHSLLKQDTDPLKLMIDFGHKNGIEVFWSMRMNDTHDSSLRKDFLFCKWKKEHPKYLVGKHGDKFPYGSKRWSSVNYDIDEVREKVYNTLYDVCSRYEIDGIELDFFRHPVLFKSQMTGDPITQGQCDNITRLIQRIHEMLTEEGLKRGRPILVAIRVPDSVGYCKAMGIDLVSWLQNGYIDIVTGADYFKLEPWENLVSLGRKFNIPVYACLESRRIEKTNDPEGKTVLPIWRGEALNAWNAGVSGIYTFNRFNPRDPLFRELGDPELLRKLEYVDQTIYVNKDSWSRPEVWMKDGDAYVTSEIKAF